LDQDNLVAAAMDEVQRLFQTEKIILFQVDSETGGLGVSRMLLDGESIDVPLYLESGEGVAGWVLEHQQPVTIARLSEDPRYSDKIDCYLKECGRANGEWGAVMAIPLVSSERGIGVLLVANREPASYREEQFQTLQAVSPMLAAALENARLYEELRVLLLEREETQSRLIYAEKMSALGRLTAAIAHEVNNPLQAVQGCLELIDEELAGERSERSLRKYMSTAKKETGRIAEIVRLTRDFYQPLRSGYVLVDPNEILDNVLNLVQSQIGSNKVAVEFERKAAGHLLWANVEQLKHVFMNLILNAVEAMPAGGMLHIDTEADTVPGDSGRSAIPGIRIGFRDEGVGMPPDVMERIFEPFFTTKELRTGLGLSISYGIVQSHGGQITAESEVGVGTTFTVWLPVGSGDQL
jgi:signal transduction histidine kinase